MKKFLIICLFFTVTASAGSTKPLGQSNLKPLSRPNILLLMAEDMSYRVRSFGDDVAVTPHIDQLAQEGTRFTNVFTTAGVCAPSRAALILGVHQESFGAQHMRTSTRPEGAYKTVPPADMKAFPELLRASGYYTFNRLKTDYQFSETGSGTGPFTIWDEDSLSAHWRIRGSQQPFFGYVSFLVTHESGVFTPLGYPPHSAVHAGSQKIRNQLIGSVPENTPVTPGDVVLEPYYPDTPTVRQDIARHYNNIAYMDAEVGAILAELKKDGLLEKTIVIWTTDHGDGLPRAKRDLFDSGIKVPMVIRWPEQYRPEGVPSNGQDERLISFVDLAPTILKLAGVDTPDFMQGQDFLNKELPEREYIYAARDRIDEVEDRQRAIRGKRYKYIRSYYPDQIAGHKLKFRDNVAMVREMRSLYKQGELNDQQSQWFEAPGEERLFDLISDPHELNDLSKDDRFFKVLESMRKAYQQWQKEHEDLSEMSETALVERFHPNGPPTVTSDPVFKVEDGKVSIISVVEGASIGYRINDGRWQLYTQPLTVSAGETLFAKAVRYGWEESDVVTFDLHSGDIGI